MELLMDGVVDLVVLEMSISIKKPFWIEADHWSAAWLKGSFLEPIIHYEQHKSYFLNLSNWICNLTKSEGMDLLSDLQLIHNI